MASQHLIWPCRTATIAMPRRRVAVIRKEACMRDGDDGPSARNVLGEQLKICCTSPMTGFYRNGRCDTGPQDRGLHVVCVEVSEAFLTFSRAQGNDLSTPVAAYGFPGLKPGDRWCLCAERWKEALDAGMAPKVVLAATHEGALAIVTLADLKLHALDLS